MNTELTPDILNRLEADLSLAGSGNVTLKAGLLKALITAARKPRIYTANADGAEVGRTPAGEESAGVSKREWLLLRQEREQLLAEITELNKRLSRRIVSEGGDFAPAEPLITVTLKSGVVDRFPCSEFKALKHSVKFITPPGWRARRYFWDDISAIETVQGKV